MLTKDNNANIKGYTEKILFDIKDKVQLYSERRVEDSDYDSEYKYGLDIDYLIPREFSLGREYIYKHEGRCGVHSGKRPKYFHLGDRALNKYYRCNIEDVVSYYYCVYDIFTNEYRKFGSERDLYQWAVQTYEAFIDRKSNNKATEEELYGFGARVGYFNRIMTLYEDYSEFSESQRRFASSESKYYIVGEFDDNGIYLDTKYNVDIYPDGVMDFPEEAKTLLKCAGFKYFDHKNYKKSHYHKENISAAEIR